MYNVAHFLSHLRRSQTEVVLDVGANRGQFASELFNAGFKGWLISFEPLRAAHAALQKAALDHPNWEVAPRCALGATAAAANVNITGNSYEFSFERPWSSTSQPTYVGTDTTRVETLANYLEQRFPGDAPRFALKIDAGGLEGEVLNGLGTHVEQCSSVLLKMSLDCLHDDRAGLPTLFARLIKSGFRCIGLTPENRHPRTLDATEVDGFFVRSLPAPEPAFHLFTSIPARLSGQALSKQREVISSWRAAGFEPISVNGPSEIAQLARMGLDIEIEAATDDGKPLIGDILSVIRKRASTRAAIINADCKLLGYPDLALSLAPILENSALYAERIEVRDDSPSTLGDCNGFDAFFFDVGILGNGENDPQFRLGETWWDYWFPLQLAANGATLGNIDLPMILHRTHEARWNHEQWLRHGLHLWAILKARSKRHPLPSPLSSLDGLWNTEKPELQRLSRMGEACFEWLRTRRLPREVTVLPSGMGSVRHQKSSDRDENSGESLDHSIEALLRNAHRSFGDIRRVETEHGATRTELAATRTELAATRTELAATRTEVAATRTELAATRTELAATRTELAESRTELSASRTEVAKITLSKSWRMTAPIRRIVYRARLFVGSEAEA